MSITNSYILPHLQVLVPEIGQGKEERMAATLSSIKEVANNIAASEPETLVIITSHGDTFENYFHLSSLDGAVATLSDYGVENVSIKMTYDTELIKAIVEECKDAGIDAGQEGEDYDMVDHGTAVPLYYIDPVMKKEYKVVRVFISGFSLLTHYTYGKCIKAAINKLGRKVTVIASGDMAHRLKEDGPLGYSMDAATFDTALTAAMQNANFLGLFAFDDQVRQNAIECCLSAYSIMAGTLDGKMAKGKMLSYEDTFGVGCGVYSYDIMDADSDEVIDSRQFDKILIEQIKEELDKNDNSENDYVRLAKKAVEYFVLYKKIPTPEDINAPSFMLNKGATVFVTINVGKQNRGCMGSITPTKPNMAEEIIAAACDAASIDPRFIPIEIEELDTLSYQVDLLGEFEPIKALSSINAAKHGLCITLGAKVGLVLPGIPGIKDGMAQLKMAQEKSGIKSGDAYNMYRFNVKRYI